jgi:hypothetical protein
MARHGGDELRIQYSRPKRSFTGQRELPLVALLKVRREDLYNLSDFLILENDVLRRGRSEVVNLVLSHDAAMLVHWFASLQPVVEGWDHLELQDSIVDSLLADRDNRNVLRQFRNAVFHYQRGVNDERFTRMMLDSSSITFAMKLSEHLHGFFDIRRRWPFMLEEWLQGTTSRTPP